MSAMYNIIQTSQSQAQPFLCVMKFNLLKWSKVGKGDYDARRPHKMPVLSWYWGRFASAATFRRAPAFSSCGQCRTLQSPLPSLSPHLCSTTAFPPPLLPCLRVWLTYICLLGA